MTKTEFLNEWKEILRPFEDERKRKFLKHQELLSSYDLQKYNEYLKLLIKS
jgi:hypothetical protein